MEFINQMEPQQMLVIFFIFICVLLIFEVKNVKKKLKVQRENAIKRIKYQISKNKIAETRITHLRTAVSDYVDRLDFLQKSVNTVKYQREQLAQYTEELEHDVLAAIVEKNFYEAELESLDVDN